MIAMFMQNKKKIYILLRYSRLRLHLYYSCKVVSMRLLLVLAIHIVDIVVDLHPLQNLSLMWIVPPLKFSGMPQISIVAP